ncbi:hypothetical protein [Actinoplanes sp. NBRC 101535]|uniref:hypothetical protein n=1 Tax=Actinoplanes sp. NBRC 101535 TaxID=3032196 RepID=UPI0024A57138|nr:hypothetical protein [Actinoplanes sp. NBRC 101535]GLY07314.1 hypothetical protein Acsp01_76930 [Actinoplanes sp. NBRC 101535]
MIMRRLMVLLLLVLAPIPVAAAPAWACSCAVDPPVDEAALVFSGVVEEVDTGWFGAASEVKVTFGVESVTKGDVGKSVTLATPAEEPSCGYEFVEGTRYRVVSMEGATTNACDGNEQLAVGPAPAQDSGRELIAWSVSGLIVLLMIGALFWLLRHPRGAAAASGPADPVEPGERDGR